MWEVIDSSGGERKKKLIEWEKRKKVQKIVIILV